MAYEKTLRDEYLGKKINVRMEDIADNSEMEWEPEEGKENAGSGTILLTYDDKDDDPSVNIQSGLYFAVGEDGKISDLRIRAKVYAVKEDGPDENDPESCWTSVDLHLARKFLDDITE